MKKAFWFAVTLLVAIAGNFFSGVVGYGLAVETHRARCLMDWGGLPVDPNSVCDEFMRGIYGWPWGEERDER